MPTGQYPGYTDPTGTAPESNADAIRKSYGFPKYQRAVGASEGDTLLADDNELATWGSGGT